MAIKTPAIITAGTDIQVPAGTFTGWTVGAVNGPALSITEDGNTASGGMTLGSGVVRIVRPADGNPLESVITFEQPTDGSGGADGRGIATITVSGTSLVGTYTDGTAWSAGALPAGPKGDAGTAASVSVGTVTTGAAGTQASVTNSGTSSAAVLDFVIPKGADGTGGGTLDAEQVQDIVGAMVKGGTNTTVAYDDAAGTLTINATAGTSSSTVAAYLSPQPAYAQADNTTAAYSFDKTGGDLLTTLEANAPDAVAYVAYRIKATAANQMQLTVKVNGVQVAQEVNAAAANGEWTEFALPSALDINVNDTIDLTLAFLVSGAFAGYRNAAYKPASIGTYTVSVMTYASVAPQNRGYGLRIGFGAGTTKTVVGPLDPADFPVSTAAAAPAKSGFMVIDDTAKTAQLVWKFSDGTTKSINLA